MRVMKKWFVTLVLVFTCVVGMAQAQQPNWPEDTVLRKIAMEKLVFYRDEMNVFKRPENAVEPISWLLKNAPELGEFLYVDAVRAYYARIQKTEDPAIKEAYQDTLMMVFDNAIKYFDNEAKHLNYKGYYAYNFYYQKPEKMEEMRKMYERIIELNGPNTYPANVQFYLLVGINLLNQKKIDNAEVVKIYLTCKDVISKGLAAAKDDQTKKQWQDTEKNVDAYFMQYVKLDCAQIESIFGDKFRQSPNKEMAAQIRDIMKAAQCYNSDLFVETMDYLFREEPTYNNAIVVATLYESKNQVSKAMEVYQKALGLASTNEEKAKVYKELMGLTLRTGAKQACRSYALKLAELDPSEAALAYTTIGDLYLKSGSECSSGENPVEQKAYAIAAYNMYKRAGNSQKMALARKYFPTKEEVFTEGMAGKTVRVNCWIGETVTIPQLSDL